MDTISYDIARLQKNFDQLHNLLTQMQAALANIAHIGSTLNSLNFGQGQEGIHSTFLRATKDGEELKNAGHIFSNKLQEAGNNMRSMDNRVGKNFTI